MIVTTIQKNVLQQMVRSTHPAEFSILSNCHLINQKIKTFFMGVLIVQSDMLNYNAQEIISLR